MATKFYLAEIPDDFPATNVKFENMTKPLLAIPPKMVDGIALRCLEMERVQTIP